MASGASNEFDFMEQIIASGQTMNKQFGLHLENELGSSHIDIGSF